MQLYENKKGSPSKKGWVEEMKGKYSNIMSSGSKHSSNFNLFDGQKNEVKDKSSTIKEENGMNIKVTNHKRDEQDEINKKKKDKKKNNSSVDNSNLYEKRKNFFEVYKKYYFIEMTEYHKSRENCSNHFLNFLERTFENMTEALKNGSDNINNLNRFFKEFLKNDLAYSRNVIHGNSKINNLTHSFLNIPNENNSSNHNVDIFKREDAKLDIERNNIIKESISNGNTFNYDSKAANRNINEEKDNSFSKYDNTQNYSNENNEKSKKEKEDSYIQNERDIYKEKNTHFFIRNNSKISINKINEIVKSIVDVDSEESNLNHNILNDWIKYSSMNYIKILNSMKLSCELIDMKIYQKKLVLLKETYIKEQEKLIEEFKKKKSDFLNQLDICKNYWKLFENSYTNSGHIRPDGIRDSKKIKCSWLCQRKYLKNVRYLLIIQNEYLEILNKSTKNFFQLLEWKKNKIRDILCSYIMLYKSFLGFYTNNLNILYDSLLQEKGIEPFQFNNLNSITIMEDDILKPVNEFHFDENCETIPKLNNALNLIKNSVLFFNDKINIRSILCLFNSNIKGYLTSVGIFNKYIEGVIVITWDKFIHFFANVEDTSPQWSYYIGDIDFKIVKSKKYPKKGSKDKNKQNPDTNDNKNNMNNSDLKNSSEVLENKENNKDVSLKINEDEIEKNLKNESLPYSPSICSNSDENEDLEIQMKEKKKTLLINGWSFTFKCPTVHLTKVCYELLKNHLYSEYFQNENSFSNFEKIISNGEIKNDLLFTDEIANFYNRSLETITNDTVNISKQKHNLDKGLDIDLDTDDNVLFVTNENGSLKESRINSEKRNLQEENYVNDCDNKRNTKLVKNIKEDNYNDEDDESEDEESEDDESEDDESSDDADDDNESEDDNNDESEDADNEESEDEDENENENEEEGKKNEKINDKDGKDNKETGDDGKENKEEDYDEIK